MTRPKVALIVTAYFFGSHADVLGTKLIEGYLWHGEHVDARVEVVSMYLEQQHGAHLRDRPLPEPDIGVEIAERHHVPLYPTVGEAIGCGNGGVAVDGVVIIGEHGDYESNELGQKLYPRRRLFDAAVATMVGARRYVPIMNDKGLSYSAEDALAMVATARRLGIPLVAGSTIPLTWRLPAGTQWPFGEAMTDAVAVGYGEAESYGFHTLEGLQAHVERRRGGETGVVAVQAYSGGDAVRACTDGTVDAELLDRALGSLELDPDARTRAVQGVAEVYAIDYADGLSAAAVTCHQEVANWGAACRGPGHDMVCQMYLPGASPGTPSDHFTFLARQIESVVLTGIEPSPVERTLLTTGILDAAMRSRHRAGERVRTPELSDIAYGPVADIADTGVFSTFAEPVRSIERRPVRSSGLS
jgi:hypothetical protein